MNPLMLILLMGGLGGRGRGVGSLLPLMISAPTWFLGKLAGKSVTATDALMVRMLGPIGLIMMMTKQPRRRYRRRYTPRRRYYRKRY